VIFESNASLTQTQQLKLSSFCSRTGNCTGISLMSWAIIVNTADQTCVSDTLMWKIDLDSNEFHTCYTYPELFRLPNFHEKFLIESSRSLRTFHAYQFGSKTDWNQCSHVEATHRGRDLFLNSWASHRAGTAPASGVWKWPKWLVCMSAWEL